MTPKGSRAVSGATVVVIVVAVIAAAFLGYSVRSPGVSTSTATQTSTATFTSINTQTATATSTFSTTVVLYAPLRIFAAASFTYALQALQTSYQKNNSVSLIYNFAGSGALETQIAVGSPCDVFMSADTANNAKLQAAGLLANNNTYSTLIYNSIELFVQPGNPKNINTLADLLNPGVRVVAEAPTVPAGKYTAQVWQNIQSKWGNTSSPDFKSTTYFNYVANIKTHVISYTTDVESAVQEILAGGADAGFAYVSDAVPQGPNIVGITIPSDVNVQAVYSISVIKTTAYLAQANQFVVWMLSPAGQAFLAKWGFTPLK
jgi:molybdate transport system substrate-binding protein